MRLFHRETKQVSTQKALILDAKSDKLNVLMVMGDHPLVADRYEYFDYSCLLTLENV